MELDEGTIQPQSSGAPTLVAEPTPDDQTHSIPPTASESGQSIAYMNAFPPVPTAATITNR